MNDDTIMRWIFKSAFLGFILSACGVCTALVVFRDTIPSLLLLAIGVNAAGDVLMIPLLLCLLTLILDELHDNISVKINNMREVKQ